MKNKLTDIITVPGLGMTPARVHRGTGTVFLNSDIWPLLSKDAQDFVLAHEEGHYIDQTVSEFQADRYALNKFVGSRENSLKKISSVVWDTLYPETNPEHKRRYLAVVRQLLVIDIVKFGNYNAYQILKKMEDQNLLHILSEYLKTKGISDVNMLTQDEKEALITDLMLSPEMIGLVESDLTQKEEFSNFGEKLKQGIKNIIGNDKVKAAFQSVAGNYITKLGKGLGLSPNADLNSINNAVLSNVSTESNQGGKSSDNGGTPPKAAGSDTQTDTEKKTKKWLVPVLIGAGLIVLAVVLYFALKPKK